MANPADRFSHDKAFMGPDSTKPVFRFSEKVVKLVRILKLCNKTGYYNFQIVNDKGADQTV